ncbi:unnamed protein product [Caenorhabditis bovis]|uniref:Uncharacterized protein n=1 Tax=Caenorhabditis bovis TaxID=2654633 RepID=A0A8S1ERC2_9PELO|nr:unnamed protein product [Caenorhabditis bovis]
MSSTNSSDGSRQESIEERVTFSTTIDDDADDADQIYHSMNLNLIDECDMCVLENGRMFYIQYAAGVDLNPGKMRGVQTARLTACAIHPHR